MENDIDHFVLVADVFGGRGHEVVHNVGEEANVTLRVSSNVRDKLCCRFLELKRACKFCDRENVTYSP